MRERTKKGRAAKAIGLLTGLAVLMILTGCASLLSQAGQVADSLFGPPPTQAEERLEDLKESFEAAKAAGTASGLDAYSMANSEWSTAVNVSLNGIELAASGNEDYLALEAEYTGLADEIVPAYEQFLLDCLNAAEDPYWIYMDIFEYLNTALFQSRMKDPDALFYAAAEKWKTSEALKVKEMGGGSARKYVSSTGNGLCWYGTSAVSAGRVDYSRLQWVFEDFSQTMNVGFITKVKPESYLRFGPDKVGIYLQVEDEFVLFKEFPVNTDGSSDEYAMSFPLKLLENEIKSRVDQFGSSNFSGNYVCVEACYLVEELEKDTCLARSFFFVKR